MPPKRTEDPAPTCSASAERAALGALFYFCRRGARRGSPCRPPDLRGKLGRPSPKPIDVLDVSSVRFGELRDRLVVEVVARLTLALFCQKLGTIADDVDSFRAAIIAVVDSGELAAMSSSGRALLAAPYVRTAWGGRRNAGPGCAPVTYRAGTIRDLAPIVGVGIKQLGYAVRVKRSGRAGLIADVEAGRVTLAAAVRNL